MVAHNPASVYQSIEEHCKRYYDHSTATLITGSNIHFTDYQSTQRLGFQLEGSSSRHLIRGHVDTGGTWTFDLFGTHLASQRFGGFAADSELFGCGNMAAFQLGWAIGQALPKGEYCGGTAATGGQNFILTYQTG